MKHSLLLLLAAIALMMSSCASQRALTGDVQGISAKIDAHIKAFNLDENANGNIKMKRGEGIQISLTKFGIEGVRVIFTPDSVLLINKLSKTYLRTSYSELDRAMGSEGIFNYRNVEAYFWNDNNQNTNYATLPIGGFVPLDVKTTYSRHIKAGTNHVPQRINVKVSGAEGAIETGEAKLKLSQIRPANNWEPNTTISSKYKSLNFVSTIKKLLKK